MINITAPTAQQVRVNCADTGKLIMTIDERGIYPWCMYQRRPELLSYEQLMGMETFRAGVLAVLASEQSAIRCGEDERPDIAV